MTAWDELMKGFTVCWVTFMAHAVSTLQSVLSFTSILFATVLGVHGVWQIWKGKGK